jgi:hypothetical protein
MLSHAAVQLTFSILVLIGFAFTPTERCRSLRKPVPLDDPQLSFACGWHL